MINKNKISVVLPTYNVEKYISRCLNSLQKQTLKDFEIVVVDDCGNDNSINIAKEYAKNDNRIKIIYNPKNMGTYHARRIGVENASGEYIVFLDPDDELKEKSLELIFNKFDETKCDMLFYGVKYLPKLKWYHKKTLFYPILKNESLLISYLSKQNPQYHLGIPGKTFRKTFLIDLLNNLNVDSDFRYVYSEDTMMIVTAMFFKPKFSVVYENCYVYHINPTSITIIDNKQSIYRNIEQLNFTIQNLRNNSLHLNLSKEEKDNIDYLFKKFESFKLLMLRNCGTKKDYFSRVSKSYLLIPTLNKFARLVLFLLSFGSIKK